MTDTSSKPSLPYLQHFIVEGKYLGNAMRGRVFIYAEPVPPHSYAFFCPVCAEVWARCPVEIVATGKHREFTVSTHPCRKHTTHALAFPGSLWNWDEDFTAAFPDAVIAWEFHQHLERT
jgi:hypothetical protein